MNNYAKHADGEICFHASVFVVCIKHNVYLRLCKDSDVDIILE